MVDQKGGLPPDIQKEREKKYGKSTFRTKKQIQSARKKRMEKRKEKRKEKGKMSQKQFSKFLLEKEKQYWEEMIESQKPCNKIQTNWAKDKKKLEEKSKCFKKYNKERLTKLQQIHKQYPEEYKRFLGKTAKEDAKDLKRALKITRSVKDKVKKGGGKRKGQSRKRSKRRAKFSQEEVLSKISQKPTKGKLIGEWKDKFIDLLTGKGITVKLQIYKVPNQRNSIQIVETPKRGWAEGDGPLVSFKINPPRDKDWFLRPTWLRSDKTLYSLSLKYGARGSYQGGPMTSYTKNYALFSFDESKINNAAKFLKKNITTGKVKKGGGKKKWTPIKVKSGKPMTLEQLRKKAIKKNRIGLVEVYELDLIVAQEKDGGEKYKFIFDGSALVDGKYVSDFLLSGQTQKKGQLVFLNGVSKSSSDKDWSPEGVQICDNNIVAWRCMGGTMIYQK